MSTSTASSSSTWAQIVRDGHAPRFLVLLLGIWLFAADSTLVATLMPKAIDDLGGVTLIGWSYSLFLAGSIVGGAVSAWLTERQGLRSSLTLAAWLFAIGCGVSALAPTMEIVLAGRLFQGFGGGSMVALAYVAADRLFPPALLPRIMGVISAVWGASAFVGPMIGGLFADAGLWRGGYWAFGVQALVMVVATMVVIRRDRPTTTSGLSARVPVTRLILLGGSIIAVSLAGSTVHPAVTPVLIVCGAILMALFLLRDRTKGDDGLLPSQTTRPATRVGTGVLGVFTLSMGTMPFSLYGPILLITLYGTDALTAGYMVALEAIAWSAIAIAVAGAAQRWEPFLIRCGGVMVVVSLVMLTLLMPNGPFWALIPAVALQGMGFGIAWGFLLRRVIAAAPEAERSRVAGAMPTVAMIGYALAAALVALVANVSGFSEGISVEAAQRVAFWIFAAFLPVSLIGMIGFWRIAR